MEEDPRAEAVAEWMNCFDAFHPVIGEEKEGVEEEEEGRVVLPSTIGDVKVLRTLLSSVDPFFKELQSVTSRDTDDVITWQEKSEELNAIKLALDVFFSKILKRGFKVEDDIDTDAMAKGRGMEDLFCLIELICGAAAMSNNQSFEQQMQKLSEYSRLYIAELRNNYFINSYDLPSGIDDYSDLSDDNSASDDNSSRDSRDKDDMLMQKRSMENSSLRCHLESKAAFDAQKKLCDERNETISQLHATIDALSSENKSLKKELSNKKILENSTNESVECTEAANRRLQAQCESLSKEVKYLKTKCLFLENDMYGMSQEIEVARSSQQELADAKDTLQCYKQKIECLTPVLAINEHLEAALKDSEAQLEVVELGISARIRLEEELRSTELEDLKKEYELMKLSHTSQQEKMLTLAHENDTLRDDLNAKKSLQEEHDKLKDDLSLQYLHSMKLEQEITSNQAIFRQYKSIIKDTYKVIAKMQKTEEENDELSVEKKNTQLTDDTTNDVMASNETYSL